MLTPQIQLWQGQLGRDWSARTDIDPKSRLWAFREMLKGLRLTSIVEVGCNKGWNLEALRILNPEWQVAGVEPLECAVTTAKEKGLLVFPGDCFHIPFDDSSFSLVFTCGCLMHVAPDDLYKAIKEIFRVSSRYFLALEYYSMTEMPIDFHGHLNLLWKRDYENSITVYTDEDGIIHPIDCIRKGHWEKSSGFNNVDWWLFEKSNGNGAGRTNGKLPAP